MKALSRAAALAALCCAQANATNGSYLIGISPQSQGAGGTGVSSFTSTSDALYKNPAMLNEAGDEVGKVSVEALTTLLKPNVTGNTGAGAVSSSAGARFLPGVAARYKFNDKLSFGLGAFAVGGNAVDYKGSPTLYELQSEEHLTRFALSASYHPCSYFSIGVTPFLTWGQLNINEDIISLARGNASQTSRGLSGAMGAGVQIGTTLKPVDNVTIGASFTTKQSLNYKQVVDLDLFGPSAPSHIAGTSTLDDIAIQQPSEAQAGVTYTGLENFTLSAEYRYIGWGHADVYRDLQWSDQHVVALGGKYHHDAWDYRLGFNWSTNPLSSGSGENGAATSTVAGHTVFAQNISLFDTVLFPSYITTHFTAGAGYQLMSNFRVDGALVYVPKASLSHQGTGATGAYNYTGSQSQWQATLAASYQF